MAGRPLQRREQALAALLRHVRLGDAAADAGVSLRSLKRWLAEPGFKQEYAAARRDLLDAGLKVLEAAAAKAAGQLVTELSGDKARDRITAACAIWDRLLKVLQLTTLEDDVAELRKQIAEMKHAKI